MPKNKPIYNTSKKSLLLHTAMDVNNPLQDEYKYQQTLYEAQPILVKRFIELQAQKLADACWKNLPQTSFTLPDQVIVDVSKPEKFSPVPAEFREQMIRGVFSRLARTDMRTMLRQRLIEFEGASDPAVSVSVRLIRYGVAKYMIHSMLPSGRTVIYEVVEGEEIPTIPVADSRMLESAITQASDAIVEEMPPEENRGELQVPFVPSARRFYLPQWVAFDDKRHLLVNSVNEAEAHISSMQSFLTILHTAVSLAPYMIADPVYQQKRYGMLGQLINQGRALTRYETEEMIHIIKQRAAAHDLNRGLSLSVPYFDDQALEIHTRDFEVIPAGRIMFVPAFVVRAVQMEQAKVAQDTRLSPSTRKYLLDELETLEKAFQPSSKA
jgi:hypothetical protein